jgi:hypothetical protein
MEPRDDIPEEQQDIDLQSLKRAIMRRDEAVERFRAAKAQMMKRARSSQDVRRQDQPPHQRQQ